MRELNSFTWTSDLIFSNSNDLCKLLLLLLFKLYVILLVCPLWLPMASFIYNISICNIIDINYVMTTSSLRNSMTSLLELLLAIWTEEAIHLNKEAFSMLQLQWIFLLQPERRMLRDVFHHYVLSKKKNQKKTLTLPNSKKWYLNSDHWI